MTPNTFEEVLRLIGPETSTTPLASRHKPIEAKKQLLVALWVYATPDSHRSICEKFDIGQATLVRSVRRVSHALHCIAKDIIKWPTEEEAVVISNSFQRKRGFPGIIGAVDGTHFRIDAPKEDPNSYVNRKGFHSIQLQLGWTKLLVIAGAAMTIGSSLTVGFNIGVVNSPSEIIKQFCNESIANRYKYDISKPALEILWSSIVSIFLIGGAVGSLGGSWLADRVGRKGGIIVSTVLSIVAAILFIISKPLASVELLFLGRLLVGLGSGLATCIVPMYLMELAPMKLRGAVGVLCPLGVTFGVLLGQLMSLSKVLGTEEWWPYLLGLYLLFVILASTSFPFIPESPKYLYIVKKDEVASMRQLMRIRGVSEDCLSIDLLELKAEKHQEENSPDTNWNLKNLLMDSHLLLPLLLVCSMQAGQQLSGINAVFYYSVSIFKKAGLSDENSQYATIGAGVINLGMAIISIHIMSKFNRRTIFLISIATSAFFLILLGIAITYMSIISWMPYLSIVGVLGFVFCYGIGLGPIPYFIGSELFEVGPRPSAMALGSMANWGGNFIVGMTFPIMQEYLGPISFFVFSFILILLFGFIKFYLPETKGQDPSLIAQMCKGGLKRRPTITPINGTIINGFKY